MALFAVTGAVCLCQAFAQDVFSCFVKQWLLVVNPGRQAMFTDETTQASLSNQCGDVLIWGCCLNVGIIIRLFICSFHTVQINPILRQPQYICGEPVTYLRSPSIQIFRNHHLRIGYVHYCIQITSNDHTY